MIDIIKLVKLRVIQPLLWRTLYRHRITVTWPNLERWVDLGMGNSTLTDDLHLQVKSTLGKYGITDWQMQLNYSGEFKRTFTLGFRKPEVVLLLWMVDLEKNT